jgi:hypothetical protein
MSKMMSKMMRKMATVNALKRKHLENDNKMHFTSLRQYSAHSNSTSKDFVKLFIIKTGPGNSSLGYLSLLSVSASEHE